MQKKFALKEPKQVKAVKLMSFKLNYEKSDSRSSPENFKDESNGPLTSLYELKRISHYKTYDYPPKLNIGNMFIDS